MFRKRLKNEAGYSLVEVMVSIILLSMAIIPMVSMFDMSLTSATKGSNYDKARALANLKMEQAKSLPFATVETDFPEAPATMVSGSYDSGFIPESGPSAADFTNFEYKVQKRYVNRPTVAAPNFSQSSTATSLIRVTITVGWGDYNAGTDTYSNTYTTYGLVAE